MLITIDRHDIGMAAPDPKRTSGDARPSCLVHVESIQWADGLAKRLLNVGVDHCGLQVAVTQQQLDRPNIGAGGKQVRGEGMSQRMH